MAAGLIVFCGATIAAMWLTQAGSAVQLAVLVIAVVGAAALIGLQDHSKKPHQSPLRQNRSPRPSPSRHLRLPARAHLNRRCNVPGPSRKGQELATPDATPSVRSRQQSGSRRRRSLDAGRLAISMAAKPLRVLLIPASSPSAVCAILGA